ncbi:gamma carbonic anhydrase family protein [Celerinatantimonas yamalensis]|uniref:Gamma carbonic anhydrase family protein n=1 Tax=Celerinatantimonas yamalensis TaxID=559956 RepID=A0ABW9GB06_9GAMM
MTVKSYKEHFPKLAQRVLIDDSAVVIGKVTLADDCSIWPLVVVRADVNTITIGTRSNVQDGSVLHVTRPSNTYPQGLALTIGDDVTIGHNATLHACQIGNRVLVGMGAIVLDGVIIEDDVMLGAGALVPPGKRLQSGYLYLGSPVTRARKLSAEEIEFLRQSALNYQQLKDEYLAQH